MWNFGGGLILKSNSDEKTLKKDIENTHKQKENKQSNNSETSEINSIKLIKETQIKEIIAKINKNDFTKSNVNEDEKILIAQHWIDIVPKVTNINFFKQMASGQNFWEITKEKKKICVGDIYNIFNLSRAVEIPVLIDDLSHYKRYIFKIYNNKSNRNFEIEFQEIGSNNSTTEKINSTNQLNSTKNQKYLIAKKILENFEKTVEVLESLNENRQTININTNVFQLNTAGSCQAQN